MGYVFHLPRLAQIMNALWTVLVLLFSNTHQIFEYSQKNFWDILDSTLFFIGFLMILILIGKRLIFEYDKKNPIGVRERCLRDYKIGCAGSILFSIISIVIIFIGPKLPIGFVVFVACNTSSIFLYFLFSWEVEKHYRLVHSWKTSGIVFVCCLCVYTMVFILLNKPTSFRAYKENSYTIFAISIYSIPLFLNTLCFVELLMCQMASLNKDNNERTVEGSFYENNSQLDGLECDICFMKFDKRIPQQTPQILIGCGHSVCEGCIESLSKKNSNHNFICPFCPQIIVDQREPREFSDLPNEILEKIFKQLEWKEILPLRQVSKRISEVVENATHAYSKVSFTLQGNAAWLNIDEELNTSVSWREAFENFANILNFSKLKIGNLEMEFWFLDYDEMDNVFKNIKEIFFARQISVKEFKLDVRNVNDVMAVLPHLDYEVLEYIGLHNTDDEYIDMDEVFDLEQWKRITSLGLHGVNCRIESLLHLTMFYITVPRMTPEEFFNLQNAIIGSENFEFGDITVDRESDFDMLEMSIGNQYVHIPEKDEVIKIKFEKRIVASFSLAKRTHKTAMEFIQRRIEEGESIYQAYQGFREDYGEDFFGFRVFSFWFNRSVNGMNSRQKKN